MHVKNMYQLSGLNGASLGVAANIFTFSPSARYWSFSQNKYAASPALFMQLCNGPGTTEHFVIRMGCHD